MTQKITPAGRLALLPPELRPDLRDLESFFEGALRKLADASPADRPAAESEALLLAHVTRWIIGRLIRKSHGQQAGQLMWDWAKFLTRVANGSDTADFPPAPDKSGLILDNIENLARQLQRIEAAVTRRGRKTVTLPAERRAA